MGFLEFAGGIVSEIGSFISNSISKIGDTIGGVARTFVDIVARLPEINVGKFGKYLIVFRKLYMRSRSFSESIQKMKQKF